MIKYIIIVVVVLLALLAVGFIKRRKHNVEIARLDQEKMQIQHYPLYEELTKIKALNMNGQTEELFENWRNAWAEVTDTHITKIDAMLFDAEEYIDRFKFKKAAVLIAEIAEKLELCENIKTKIISELEELMGSEEKNRIEMEQLKDYYRQARKTVLAHQFSFGPALKNLEERIENFTPKFDEFDALTQEGNYLQAREIVLSLNTEAQTIFTLLSDIPTLLGEIQTKIPTAIHELRSGLREMEEKSYYLVHLELPVALDRLERELEEIKQTVANLEIEQVKKRIDEMNTEIDQFYDLLEKEVIAKKFVDTHCAPVHTLLNKVIQLTRSLSDEAAFVQHSYRLSDKEAELPRNSLKQLEVIQKRYELLATRVEEGQSACTSLQEELQEIQDEVERIHEEQENFSNRLKNLRVDENKARQQLEGVRKMLHDIERTLHRANMPGIPGEMDARLEEAEEQIFIVVQSLEEVPLNMELVVHNLSNAQKCIEEVREKADEMILNVLLIERIIQYGNRYRASNAHVHSQLAEAEEAFLQCRYLKALETAAAAVESVESGAIKRIEALVEEELLEKA